MERYQNPNKTCDVIENKKKSLKLKEWGNDAFKRKKYEIAEQFYSKALEKNLDLRTLWTDRAICRNAMKKHEDALADCISALSIDPKCTKAGVQIVLPKPNFLFGQSDIEIKHLFESPIKSITQKGNAHLGLGQFDEAKECYESLRTLGKNSTADQYLKELNDAQERDLR